MCSACRTHGTWCGLHRDGTFTVFFDMHYPLSLSDFNTGSISPAAIQNQVAGKSHPAYMATVHWDGMDRWSTLVVLLTHTSPHHCNHPHSQVTNTVAKSGNSTNNGINNETFYHAVAPISLAIECFVFSIHVVAIERVDTSQFMSSTHLYIILN